MAASRVVRYRERNAMNVSTGIVRGTPSRLIADLSLSREPRRGEAPARAPASDPRCRLAAWIRQGYQGRSPWLVSQQGSFAGLYERTCCMVTSREKGTAKCLRLGGELESSPGAASLPPCSRCHATSEPPVEDSSAGCRGATRKVPKPRAARRSRPRASSTCSRYGGDRIDVKTYRTGGFSPIDLGAGDDLRSSG